MKGRRLVLASALTPVALAALASFAAVAVEACTSTQTVVTLSGVCNGTVTFSVSSPGDGACVEPNVDGTIPVTVEALNFALRPPGASCAFVCNCGFLQVYVNGVLNNQSGTAVVDADFRTDGGIAYGTHTVTVQLVWDLNDGGGADAYDAGFSADAGNGSAATGTFHRSFRITLAPSCQDSGLVTDGGSGDGGAADAGSGDGGSSDGGTADAGSSDAGSSDAGSVDAGFSDAGSVDAGPTDAGSGDGGDAG